ncbi:hypothetical protein FQN54_009112 [Arachnomyces sp. PD_36]|nr:hypothetical protein FQN54_009112 [Arachnomyces sp. PD_36]
MNWSLGSTLPVDNQPAPAPIVLVTGHSISYHVLFRVCDKLANIIYNGKVADFLEVTKEVDFCYDDDVYDQDAITKGMVKDFMELDIGGCLAKRTTYVLATPCHSQEEAITYLVLAGFLSKKRRSTLVHLDLSMKVLDRRRWIYAGIGIYDSDHAVIKEENIVFPMRIPVDIGVLRMYLNLIGLVPSRDRVHLLTGNFKPWDPNYHPEAPRITLLEVYEAIPHHYVQFQCITETVPVFDEQTKSVTVQFVDRTASLEVTFHGMIPANPNKRYLSHLRPGHALQLAYKYNPPRSFSLFGDFSTPITKATTDSIPAIFDIGGEARATIWRKTRPVST